VPNILITNADYVLMLLPSSLIVFQAVEPRVSPSQPSVAVYDSPVEEFKVAIVTVTPYLSSDSNILT
jgi:hypothetical protein